MLAASMSEAERLNGLFSSQQTILTIVLLFFAIVSGYIATLCGLGRNSEGAA
jgi:hypothetical protein